MEKRLYFREMFFKSFPCHHQTRNIFVRHIYNLYPGKNAGNRDTMNGLKILAALLNHALNFANFQNLEFDDISYTLQYFASEMKTRV